MFITFSFLFCNMTELTKSYFGPRYLISNPCFTFDRNIYKIWKGTKLFYTTKDILDVTISDCLEGFWTLKQLQLCFCEVEKEIFYHTYFTKM